MESKKYCSNCGGEMDENAAVCVKCGTAVEKDPLGGIGTNDKKSKIVAGILAITLGEFGVDKFYLGYNKAGVARVVTTLVSLVLCLVFIGIIVFLAVEVWCIYDAVKIFIGKTPDANGNKLV